MPDESVNRPSPHAPSSLRRQPRAAAHAVVSGVTRNSVALARALLNEGTRVTMTETTPVDPALGPAIEALRAAGVTFTDLDSASDFDVFFVEGLSGANIAMLDTARRRGASSSTLVEFVFARSGARTLGVTGTAGKSTVTSLVAHLLRGCGLTVHAVTDQGPETQMGPNYELVEAIGALQSGVVVVELAEQRLASMNTSPDIAVVASLAPDHIEDFGSFEAYVDATRTIVRHQDSTGWAVLPDRDDVLAQYLPFCGGRVATFGVDDSGRETAVFVRDGAIVGRHEGTETRLGLAPADRISLQNAIAACAAALVAGGDPEAIATSLPLFAGTRFRRQVVYDRDGICVVNDSLATTPFKARAGIDTLDRPIVWVAGGRATIRSDTFVADAPALEDLRSLAASARGKVRAAFVYGPSGGMLLERLGADGVVAEAAADLEAAVSGAVSVAREGDVVLFAPGMYVPPEDRARFDVLVAAGLDHAVARPPRSAPGSEPASRP